MCNFLALGLCKNTWNWNLFHRNIAQSRIISHTINVSPLIACLQNPTQFSPHPVRRSEFKLTCIWRDGDKAIPKAIHVYFTTSNTLSNVRNVSCLHKQCLRPKLTVRRINLNHHHWLWMERASTSIRKMNSLI